MEDRPQQPDEIPQPVTPNDPPKKKPVIVIPPDTDDPPILPWKAPEKRRSVLAPLPALTDQQQPPAPGLELPAHQLRPFVKAAVKLLRTSKHANVTIDARMGDGTPVAIFIVTDREQHAAFVQIQEILNQQRQMAKGHPPTPEKGIIQ